MPCARRCRARADRARADLPKLPFLLTRAFPCSFKVIIDRLANRVNTINGRRYKDEPCILAWETGNELTAGKLDGWRELPAPASWTLAVAKHLKSRAPRTLVMDGSFARYMDPSSMFPKEVLDSPDVDILSYHHYGNGEAPRIKKECEVARRSNKACVPPHLSLFCSSSAS